MTLPPKAIVLVAILLPAGYAQSSMDAVSITSSDDTATSYDSDAVSDSVVPGAEEDPLGPCLVGTVELSFSETTRYKYMTLNPPSVRSVLSSSRATGIVP